MSQHQTGQTIDYQLEIDLAVSNLNADRSDIEQLTLPLGAKGVSRQQVSGLVNLSWQHLQELRKAFEAFSTSTSSGSGELIELVGRCESALQSGSSFSLESVAQSLDLLQSNCGNDEERFQLLPTILAMQALVAASSLEYERAAEIYRQAAQFGNIDSELQFKFQMARATMLLDYGREFGNNESLHKAMDLLEDEISDLVSQEAQPADW